MNSWKDTVKDFLFELGLKAHTYIVEISIFHWIMHCQTYQNFEQPQNSYFQSHFSVLKIGGIFPKKLCEEYPTRRPTFTRKYFLKMLIFKVFHSLKLYLILSTLFIILVSLTKDRFPLYAYRISANSFCGNYSRAETIRGNTVRGFMPNPKRSLIYSWTCFDANNFDKWNTNLSLIPNMATKLWQIW